MAPGGRVPDAEPHAPCTRGAYVSRGKAGRSEFADSSDGRHDQTGRCGLLHPSALLSTTEFEISARDPEAVVASARDAHGRTARGHVACIDPQKSWLHASGGRP